MSENTDDYGKPKRAEANLGSKKVATKKDVEEGKVLSGEDQPNTVSTPDPNANAALADDDAGDTMLSDGTYPTTTAGDTGTADNS